jgi:thiamine pyrophosphate-dependent acetolactate synthase large subunit-like protein
MGFALPGAIAAGIVHPDRRVLAIAGDAGFLMNVQEMETAKRIGSNIVVLVWADNEYGLIAWKQETHFGRHTDLSFGNPDWEQLASAFGWNGHYVSRSEDFSAKLRAPWDDERIALRERTLTTSRQEWLAVDLCRMAGNLIRQEMRRAHRHGPAERTMPGIDEQSLHISRADKRTTIVAHWS